MYSVKITIVSPTLAWIILKFVYLLQKRLIIAVIVDASSGIKEIKKSRNDSASTAASCG